MNVKRITRSIACSVLVLLAGHALATPILAPGAFPAPGGTTYTTTGSSTTAGGLEVSYSGFDPSAYANLYYAVGDYQPDWTTVGPSLSMDGSYDPLTYSSALSDLAAGVLVWTGSTSFPTLNAGTLPVSTEFVLHVTDGSNNPLALTSAASLGLDASLGGVLQVQGAFNANWSFLAKTGSGSFVPALQVFDDSSYQKPAGLTMNSSVGGAFYYDATPVPEPRSSGMLVAGIAAVGLAVRRRSIRR